MLRSAITSMLPGAIVKSINDAGSLDAEVGTAALILVNRVLDGSFGDRTGNEKGGLALIASLASRGDHSARLMLVSNHADAQKQAVARGAMPGFGKSDLYSRVLRDVLADVARPARA